MLSAVNAQCLLKCVSFMLSVAFFIVILSVMLSASFFIVMLSVIITCAVL